MAGRRTSGARAERSSEDEAFSRVRAKRSAAASGSSTGTARTSGLTAGDDHPDETNGPTADASGPGAGGSDRI